MLGKITRALVEPIEERSVFLGWDAAKGKDRRRQELCARIRSTVNFKLRFKYKAVMRHQSFWRLLDITPDNLEKLAEEIEHWMEMHFEGDSQWWRLTKEQQLSRKLAKRLGVDNPENKDFVDNPWFDSDEKPECRSDYRLFVMGETPTAKKFGIALEMETLAKWASSITESAEKAINAQQTSKQQQRILKRKLEGILEFLKEYGSEAPRYKEIHDELMIADDLIRDAEKFREDGGKEKNGK